MKTLKKITNFVSGNMAVIVIVVAAIALFSPQTVSFLKTSYVNPLLGVVMFGMGLTLKPQDFKVVFSRPKDVIIGCIAQFTVMPLLAFGLTKVFGLSTELAIGDAIAYVNEQMETDEGMRKKYTFSGSVYFNRMKELGLYSTDVPAIQAKVEKAGLTGVFSKKLV